MMTNGMTASVCILRHSNQSMLRNLVHAIEILPSLRRATLALSPRPVLGQTAIFTLPTSRTFTSTIISCKSVRYGLKGCSRSVQNIGNDMLNENIAAMRAMTTVATASPAIQLDDKHEVVVLWRALLGNEAIHLRRKKSTEGEMVKSMDVEPAEDANDTGAIELPEGVVWLHRAAAARPSRSLFVRACSFAICDLIEERHRDRLGGAVVVGTPGIGKSWLANLLLLRAAREKRNVIFESVKEDIVYFFGNDGNVRRIGPPARALWPFADDPNTLYIMDAGGKGIHREPLFVNAFTVVLASPDENHYGQFVKEIGLSSQLFYPDWTLAELYDVLPFVDDRDKIGNLSDAIVKERFYKIGGIPRHVFGSNRDFEQSVHELEASMRNISSFQFDLLATKERRWNEIPNSVFTLRSEFPFDESLTKVARASRYVDDLLSKKLHGRKMELLQEFSVAFDEASALLFGSTKGLLFEVECCNQFMSGGQVQLRFLSSPALPTSHRNLTACSSAVNNNPDDIPPPLKQHIIYWPENKNFPGIDGFLVLDDTLVLIQATVSPKRYLPVRKISEFLSKVGPHISAIKQVQYWFMVPPLQSAEFFVVKSASANDKKKSLPTKATYRVDAAARKSFPLQILVASWVKK